jgi:hypothetical protein
MKVLNPLEGQIQEKEKGILPYQYRKPPSHKEKEQRKERTNDNQGNWRKLTKWQK